MAVTGGIGDGEAFDAAFAAIEEGSGDEYIGLFVWFVYSTVVR